MASPLSQSQWRTGGHASEAPAIVVGGCGRTGTTLIRVILDTHPRICCGPESALFLPRLPSAKLAARFGFAEQEVATMLASCGSQGEFIDRFFARYCEIRGKPRWAEKTPKNVYHLEYVFEHFPRTRFIHMIRDARDTVCSLRTHPRHKVVDGRLVERNTSMPIAHCVARWVRSVSAGLKRRGDPRYIEIRYEDLVTEPLTTLKRLFEFVGEEFDERVLEFHREEGNSRDFRHFPQNAEATRAMYTTAVARWERELTPDDLTLIKREAGPLMVELGYIGENGW